MRFVAIQAMHIDRVLKTEDPLKRLIAMITSTTSTRDPLVTASLRTKPISALPMVLTPHRLKLMIPGSSAMRLHNAGF
ncbi:MAG: hypothetical protein QXX18_09870 [Candidatus Jordarchaeales archaeon]